MDGLNEEWNISSRDGSAVYTTLKPGKYTFRVKVVNSDGIFTDESTISFVIKKPFWQSNIAYCIYVGFMQVSGRDSLWILGNGAAVDGKEDDFH